MLVKLSLTGIVCTILLHWRFQPEEPPIVAEVEKYLNDRTPAIKRGTEEYYALGSLDQRLRH